MKNKNEINIFFFIFLLIALTTIFIDYLTFLFNINYIIELIIGILFTFEIGYFIRKKIKIIYEFEKADLIFFTILIIIMLTTIVFPDKMYDSINYHLYNQMYPFADKINIDFFPNSFIQSYSYAFPDRIFYIFRYTLGYRLGTILNYFVIVITYYQVKKIIKEILKSNSFTKCIISCFSVLSLSILDIMDTYYIDLISMVLLFELFIQVIYNIRLEEDKKTNYFTLSYIALLSGLILATKISNLFFIIVLAVIYIIINRKKIKNLKIGQILVFMLLFFIPSILYIYTTYKQTGNPVFPFYNTIFKSDYYPLSNWMDNKFGPTGIKSLILWPLYAVKNSCRSIDTCFVEPMWALGYISAIIYIIWNGSKKLNHRKVDKNKMIFSILVLILNLVWAKFTLGYVRYALFILVLDGIITYCLLYDVIIEKKYVITSFIIIGLIYNIGYSYNLYTNVGGFWSYNNYHAYGKDAYKYNVKKLFSKNDIIIEFPENSVWGVVNSNSGFMKLLNEKIPMLYLRDNGLEFTKNKLEEKLENIEHLYIISDYLEFESFIASLNQTEYTIKKLYDVYKPSYMNYNNFLYVFELEKKDLNSNDFQVTSNYEIKMEKENEKISLLYGLDGSMHNVPLQKYNIIFEYNGKIIEKRNIEFNNHQLNRFEYTYDKLDSENNLHIYIEDENGNKIKWINLLILNVEVE